MDNEAYIPAMYKVGMTSNQREVVYLFEDCINMMEVFSDDDNRHEGYAKSAFFWISVVRELEEI